MIELLDDEQYFDIIYATGSIQDLEEAKWELMIDGKYWEAYKFQIRIDQILMHTNE